VKKRFATGDRHHRRAALIHGVEGILHRHILVQDRIRIVDLPAAGASQVAPEQRFKHQHQRVTLSAGQALTENIATDK
jgi:hypothetical protein